MEKEFRDQYVVNCVVGDRIVLNGSRVYASDTSDDRPSGMRQAGSM